jgi:hypothetical protein
MLHPMEHFETVDGILAYPFPDFNEPYRWQGMDDKIAYLKQSDSVWRKNLLVMM